MFPLCLPALLLTLGGGAVVAPDGAAAVTTATTATGAAGPANRWHTAGGGSARTGETLTAPIQAPVEIVWTHDARGEIEGEPLVWNEWVLITVRQGPDLRVLRALDLLDGRPLVGDHVVRSTMPLEPSIWRNTVAYRAGPEMLAAVELSSRRFESLWTLRAEGPVGPPLLVGSSICATVAGQLTRFALGRPAPVWEQEGRFRGRVALRDEEVFAIDYDSSGRAFVARHDWVTGAARGRQYAGHHGGPLPEDGDTPGVHVLDAGIFAHFDAPLGIVEGRDVHVVGLSRAPGMDPSILAPLPGTLELSAPPAAWGASWIGPVSDQHDAPALVLKRDPLTRELRALATPSSNPEFLPRGNSVTVAGHVGFVGAQAFDLETSRVLWTLPIEACERTVLARETVLVVDSARRLIAIRRAHGSGAAPSVIEVPERVEAGRLVLRDGSIEDGAFAVDPRAGTVRLARASGASAASPASGESWPLTEVLLLEDAQARVLFGRDAVRGVRGLVERDLGRAYLELANEARASNDAALIEELIGQAWEHGVSGRELDAASRTLAVLRARPSSPRRALIDEVRGRQRALQGLATEAFWERTRALEDDALGAWRLAMLRATLEEQPSHAPAAALVRELLPPELRSGRSDTTDPLEWLTFLEATRRAPVRLVRAPASEASARSESERALARARRLWRGDLLGFESEHLLILTPLDRPGVMARCLSLGELVCQALQSILPARKSSGGSSANSGPKLVLHLFETQAEYLEHSRPDGGEGGAGLSWAAGHYSPAANVSSIFVPPGAEAFEEVMETYAHELTHHWLSARSAAAGGRERTAADERRPGFWIVEGFACLIDEFEFDLERGEWHTRTPLSRRQDLVANAKPSQLLPWATLYGTSHERFAGMSFEGRPSLGSRCFLGMQQVVSGRHLFYAQAAATCRYLFEAPDPRLRQALLDYVEAYYGGRTPALEVEAAFGLDAQVLGARTRAHARAALGLPAD